MKPKIGYFEIYRHSECLNNFCDVYKNSAFADHIYIFTIERIALEFKPRYPNINWLVKSDESISEFLINNSNIINKLDLLFIGTMVIYDDLNHFINSDFKPKMILRVHNFNSWFNRSKSFDISRILFEPYKSIRRIIVNLILMGNIFKVKNFLSKIDFFMFYNENMREYAINMIPSLRTKTIPSLLFIAPQVKPQMVKIESVITITIPGTIDKKRRDYDLIHDLLNNLKSNLKEKLIVKFLGIPANKSSKKLIEKIKQLSSSKLKIITFNHRLNHKSYLEETLDSLFFLTPIKLNTYNGLYKEVYGKTKAAGIEDDIIKYIKPTILPQSFNLPKHLEPFVVRYKDKNDLYGIVTKIINQELILPSPDYIFKEITNNYKFSLNYINNKIWNEILLYSIHSNS